MEYRDYRKESSTLFDSALDDILTMFKEKKAKEIEFAVPLIHEFKYGSLDSPLSKKGEFRITKIVRIKPTIYFVDDKNHSHAVYELCNKMDIFTIYHSIYKYLYENVNVARNLQ